MNDSQKYIKNLIFSNNGSQVVQNTPSEYSSRQKQYLAKRTEQYANERAYLATDYCQAEVQGLTNIFYDYTTTNIRLADIISPSAGYFKRQDDYKEVLIVDKKVDYLPIGAKIKTMGSTWLVVNPSNISKALTTSVVARCNATYNSYDYYGNIITEPIVVEKYTMSGNDNEHSINVVLMDGYFNITCQLNKNTQKLGINKRIMLGSKPYHITGFTDFIQEFTDVPNIKNNQAIQFIADVNSGKLDVKYPNNYNGPTYKVIGGYLYQINPDGSYMYIENGMAFLSQQEDFSTRLITFTARLDEPTINDDIENKIADGNSYQVSAELNGSTDLIAGTQAVVTPSFLINGKSVDSTEEYPLTWLFDTNDSEIATVDQNGLVIAKAQGTVEITATLSQNPSISASLEIVITEQLTEPYIAFDGFTVDYISQYNSATFSATYFENNFATDYPLKWTFSGAKKNDYIATVSEDGKSVTIECLSASEKPLTIKASYNGYLAKIKINLVGY